MELNVTVVAGERGLAVVDTLGSAAAAAGLVEDLRGLPYAERGLVAAVNTHEHWDHVFGNADAARRPGPALALHAHEEAAARTLEAGERVKGYFRDDARGPLRPATCSPPRSCPAETTFSSVGVVDLGDRVLELMHPGRGHTGGDLVVRIGDVDVVVFGDLVEEAGPPAFGARLVPAGVGRQPRHRDRPHDRADDRRAGSRSGGAALVRHRAARRHHRGGREHPGGGRAGARASRRRCATRSGRSPPTALEHAVRRGFAQLPAAVTPGSARQLPLA